MQTQFPKVELPQIPQRVYRIEEYGAVKGGEVSNTEAIRKAIEAAHDSGGGRVVVSAGIWLTGPVELLSHVELHVEQGGLLLFHKKTTTGAWAKSCGPTVTGTVRYENRWL